MRPSNQVNNNNNNNNNRFRFSAAANFTSEIEPDDIYRHNIDALQTFLKENEGEQTGSAKVQALLHSIIRSRREGEIIPVGEKNYYIPTGLLPIQPAESLADLLQPLIKSYLEHLIKGKSEDEVKKIKASRLYQDYLAMLNGTASESTQQAIHDQEQSKKWTLISIKEMPDSMKNGYERVHFFVSFYPVEDDQEKIKDLVQIAQHSDSKRFRNSEAFIESLRDANIQMEIEGKTYFIRGIQQDDCVVFMKCETEGQEASAGTVVSEANIRAYKQENHVKSFSMAVMETLSDKLQDQSVAFIGPSNQDNPKPVAKPKPKQ